VKFLIDECLTLDLRDRALTRGYEAAHVAHIGLAGTKDWDLMPYVLEEDWTLVTKNSVDFRGARGEPGEGGEYAEVPIHAGLVLINSGKATGVVQCAMFDFALDKIENELGGDLVNNFIEVDIDPDGSFVAEVFEWPVS